MSFHSSRSRVWRMTALAAAGVLMQWCATGRLMAKEPFVEIKRMTIWQWIKEVPRQIPFTRAKVEALLKGPLVPADNSGNPLFYFWTGGVSELVGGVGIKGIDLRLKREGPHVGFLVVYLTGTCTTSSELRARYPDLRLTDYPRGPSLDEEASYSSERLWGTLSFNISQRKPECLDSISFDSN